MGFINKVVLITGAASGIGEAIALYFAKQSASLSLFDYSSSNLDQVSKKCESISKIKVFQVIVDVTNDVDLKEAVDLTVKEYGKIDVLVNCAGIAGFAGIENPDTLDVYDKVINVNLRAVVAATHFAVPALIESKGSIVNISSVLAKVVTGNAVAYNISKAAVTHLTKCLALELAERGVRVNCVSPGPLKTNLLINVNNLKKEDSNKIIDNFINVSPLKYGVKAEEIAEIVGFLASDKAMSITGEEIVVDSGFSLTTAIRAKH